MQLDMNLIITSHQKDIYGSNMQKIGIGPDSMKGDEYVFDYVYANYNGDKRACDDAYLPNFGRKSVPFPSNEQMIYDSGEDLKAKLKDILNINKFRR
jgi:hypothetical protein